MDNSIIILIIVIVLIMIAFVSKEHYNQGALIQLAAKGPQDTYLTGDAWKYIPYWYYPYRPFWNMPTRIPYYSYWY